MNESAHAREAAPGAREIIGLCAQWGRPGEGTMSDDKTYILVLVGYKRKTGGY